MSYVIFFIYEGVFFGFVYVCLDFIFVFFIVVNGFISKDILLYNFDK